MKDTVTLKLTYAEALALDELVNTSAEKFFCVVGGDKDYRLVGWDKPTAASACDKLRAASAVWIGQELLWNRTVQQFDQEQTQRSKNSPKKSGVRIRGNINFRKWIRRLLTAVHASKEAEIVPIRLGKSIEIRCVF